MASRKDIVAGGAAVEIRAIDKATTVMREVAGSFVSAGQKIAAVGMKMVTAAATASAAIVAMSIVTASWGASIDDASKRTGAGAEALQELRYGAEQSGASFDDLVAGFRNMNKELADDKSSEKLEAIGLNINEIRKLKPDEQFVAIAEALSKVKDAATQTDAAMGIFGKGGFALLPMLQEGANGINAFREEAKRLGLVLSGDIMASFAQYDDTMARIMASTKAISSLFAASFLPVLQPIADVVTAVTSAMAAWLGENQQVGSMIAVVIAVVGGLGMAFVAIGSILAGPISLMASFATIASGFIAVLGAAAAPFAAVAAAVGLLLAGLTALAAMWALDALAAADFDQTIAGVSGSLSGLWESINQVYQSLVSQFGPAIQGVITAIGEADFYSAGKIAFLGLQLAASEIMQQISSFCLSSMYWIGETIVSSLKAILSSVGLAGGKYLDGIMTNLKAEHAGMSSALEAVYESRQMELRSKIDSQKKGVDDNKAKREEIDKLNSSLDLEIGEDFATRLQQKEATQPKSGFEPQGDATKTVGTAASGIAGMVVSPMMGAMQPVVDKLEKQLAVQNKIEANTKANAPTFGA